jgi:hypothetical protein
MVLDYSISLYFTLTQGQCVYPLKVLVFMFVAQILVLK